ncbi:MAG: hypothetical protein IV093_08425 [Rubrivivax sp.]|nr:hypothetical protein [Rubrivivax sp.]
MSIAQTVRAASAAALLFVLPLQGVMSAQDHNSSRSNKTNTASAPNEIENLLDLSRADASAVAKTMIAADTRDGYNGDYEITVNVAVSIKRVKSR